MTSPASTFEPFRPAVYSWALKVVARHEDALDISQDVCLKWLTRSESQRLSNPRAWLRTVTINCALDILRARKSHPTATHNLDTLNDKQPGPTTLLAHDELHAKVQIALATLTENQRSVLVAKVFDGETFAQIAQDLGLAIPTVKTHYLRALAAMEPQLRNAR